MLLGCGGGRPSDEWVVETETTSHFWDDLCQLELNHTGKRALLLLWLDYPLEDGWFFSPQAGDWQTFFANTEFTHGHFCMVLVKAMSCIYICKTLIWANMYTYKDNNFLLK